MNDRKVPWTPERGRKVLAWAKEREARLVEELEETRATIERQEKLLQESSGED